MIPFESGNASYLPLLLCRLIGTEGAQDAQLPLPVLVNLARGYFAPIYHLLMRCAVEKAVGDFEGQLPWDTVVGGYYSPENHASHTYGFAESWPEGVAWMNRDFDTCSNEQQTMIGRYGQLGEATGYQWGTIYEITEPLVALFSGLCYAAGMGVSGNEAWLHTVATSQRIRWEALLDSELYRMHMRKLGL